MNNSTYNPKAASQKSQDKATLSAEQISGLIKNLTKTTQELYFDGNLEHWEGVDLLQKLINRGQSCLVIGEDRGGKACAAALCEDGQHKDVILIPCPSDIDGIYYDLWTELGMLLPHDNWNRTKRYNWDTLNSTCGECERECPLKKSKGSFFLWPEPDKAQYEMGKVTGNCILMRYIVLANLQKLKNDVVMIRIPDVNNDLIKLLIQLLENTRVIILANPEQNQLLLKYNRFRQLPSWVFPKPPPNLFPKILQSRMKEIGMSISAFDIEACNVMALLSKYNFGGFNTMAARVLNQIELDGKREQVDVGYTLKLLTGSLDKATMAMITLSKHKGWVSAEDLSIEIENTYRVSIPEKSLGKLLKPLVDANKIDRREIGGIGTQYRIRELTLPLLEAGGIDTIEALPEGDND
jgi:DNA-binding transcriptional ArsR family regulator